MRPLVALRVVGTGGFHERPVESSSLQRLGSLGAPHRRRDHVPGPRQPEAGDVEDAASAQMPAGLLSLLRVLSIAEPLGALATLVGLLTQAAAEGGIPAQAGGVSTHTQQLTQTWIRQRVSGVLRSIPLCGTCPT